MKKTTILALALWASLSCCWTAAWAQEPSPPPGPAQGQALRLLHTPPSSLVVDRAHQLTVLIEGDWRLKRAWVEARPLGTSSPWQELELRRSARQHFTVELPRALVQAPGLEYRVLSEDLEGRRQVHLELARVLVLGRSQEAREAQRLRAHRGKRSAARVSGELTLYGRRLYAPTEQPTEQYSDRFWVSEAEYTYRTLGFLYDIRFGLGVIRGQRAAVDLGEQRLELDGPPGSPAPGLNYGWSEANFALWDNFSVGLRLTLGASEEGFAAGLRGLVRVGALTDTHLELGAEALQDAGSLSYMSFRWQTIPRVPMGMTLELSSRPDGDSPLATRLIWEVGWQLHDSWQLQGRLGYGARVEALEGGLVAGLGLLYEF